MFILRLSNIMLYYFLIGWFIYVNYFEGYISKILLDVSCLFNYLCFFLLLYVYCKLKWVLFIIMSKEGSVIFYKYMIVLLIGIDMEYYSKYRGNFLLMFLYGKYLIWWKICCFVI